MHNERVCFMILGRQRELISRVSQTTQLSQSEIVRRLFDYSLSSEHLNKIVPMCSGRMETQR